MTNSPCYFTGMHKRRKSALVTWVNPTMGLGQSDSADRLLTVGSYTVIHVCVSAVHRSWERANCPNTMQLQA